MNKNTKLCNLLPMVEESKKYEDFALRLNELMSERGLTIGQLKDAAGVTYEMARRYTLGTAKPRDEKMLKISEWLNVSPAYLDYGIGTAQPEQTRKQKIISDLASSLPDSEQDELIKALGEKKNKYDQLYEEMKIIKERNRKIS